MDQEDGKKDIASSVWSMHGYILIYSRLWARRERERFWAEKRSQQYPSGTAGVKQLSLQLALQDLNNLVGTVPAAPQRKWKSSKKQTVFEINKGKILQMADTLPFSCRIHYCKSTTPMRQWVNSTFLACQMLMDLVPKALPSEEVGYVLSRV